MINRELQTIQVVTFSSGVDSYGQPRQTIASTRDVQAVVKPYGNEIVDNPKYNDIELIVLTDDRSINDAYQIKIGTKYYDIMWVIPSHRYNLLLLRCVK